MKSGNLNFLEPTWPLQGCNGTALPLPLPLLALHLLYPYLLLLMFWPILVTVKSKAQF